MSDYRPIDCSLHDRYEASAILKRRVQLRWRAVEDEGLRTTAGAPVREHTGLITDIRTRDGAEFLVLDDTVVVRLDQIDSFEIADDPTAR